MCQDCKGTKQVPLGFYAGFPNGIGQNPQTEACRKCTGQGVTPGRGREITTAIIGLAVLVRLVQALKA